MKEMQNEGKRTKLGCYWLMSDEALRLSQNLLFDLLSAEWKK
jgi:hypothetical protein